VKLLAATALSLSLLASAFARSYICRHVSVLEVHGELDLPGVQSLGRQREAVQGSNSVSVEGNDLDNICVIEKIKKIRN
jgi:hypothetical protein